MQYCIDSEIRYTFYPDHGIKISERVQGKQYPMNIEFIYSMYT